MRDRLRNGNRRAGFCRFLAVAAVLSMPLVETANGQPQQFSNHRPAPRESTGAVEPNTNSATATESAVLQQGLSQILEPSGLTSTLKVLMAMTVLSLAPSILIMTTCFIRFVVVLSLLRQALGTPQLPPNQVLVSLCVFLTYMVMSPVWQKSYREGIEPYTTPAVGQASPGLDVTLERTLRPIRNFMIDQIEASGNTESVYMFVEFQQPPENTSAGRNYKPPETYDEVPLSVLMPAFMLSELKTAFVIGFQLYLPFLVIDMVVSSVLISMGMMMLPPALISLPFKLLLFVMIDGWHLTVEMMLKTVVSPGGG